MSLATPYRQSPNTDKVEKYKEKLKQRADNQNWILNNYFGKPGGGAPLKDRTGHLITKIKTIADGNIYVLPSKEFSKVDSEGYEQDYSRINSQGYNEEYERMIQGQQQQQRHYNDYTMQAAQQLQQQTNPYNQMPPSLNPYPYDPHMMMSSSQSSPFVSYPFYYPIVIQQQHQQPPSNNYYPSSQLNPMSSIDIRPTTHNDTINMSILNQSQNQRQSQNQSLNLSQTQTQSQSQNEARNNQIITYALPQQQDKKDIQDKDVQKQLWKRELLVQIEEKKQRDLNEKKSLIEKDKSEEIKYQEYLRIKKDQAEQQELKRKNKIRKMITQLNESGDLEQKQQLENIIESSANKLPSPKQFNTNINNNKMLPTLTDDEYKNQHEFKAFIDSQYINLNQSLKEDFDLEMKKMQHEPQTKYNTEQKELFGQLNDHPTQLTNHQIYNEKRIRHIQDMIEQRKLVDYVLSKDKIGNVPPFNEEVDLKIPSFFGQNKDDKTKYVNLQSASSFIYNNNENHPSFEEQKVMTYVDKDKQLKQTGVCVDRSLENISSFHPFIEEDPQQNNRLKIMPNQVNSLRSNDDQLFMEMFGKLDDIAELSKNIDKTLKYKAIHGNYEIDLIDDKQVNH